MHRFHQAKLDGDRQVSVWGTGTPRRELLHVDDLADACVFLLDSYDDPKHVNVGTGEDLPVGTIAEMIRDVVYPEVELVFDHTKPDGMMRKVLDVSKLHRLGWHHRIALPDGVRSTYDWFLAAPDVRGWDRTPVG
jgi:GDP-L-fucose synthase